MIHHVFANRSNIGDWLSARGIQFLLRPHKVVEHLCDEPFVPETLDRLSSATKDDLIVIGGGGLFMDYFEPFWRGFLPIAERVPFVIWGVGYCDMKRVSSLPSTELLEQIVSMSRLCLVRDELTRNYLKNCQLPSAVPCPSMILFSPSETVGNGLLYADAYDNIGPTVYEATIEKLQKFAVHTGRNYRQTNNTIRKGKDSELERTLRLYRGSDLVVASRLHGCILGIAMGRRVLAISGDRKIESFMQAAGLDGWVLGLEQIGKLEGKLEALLDQAFPSDFVAMSRRDNYQFAEEVKNLISDSSPITAPPNRTRS